MHTRTFFFRDLIVFLDAESFCFGIYCFPGLMPNVRVYACAVNEKQSGLFILFFGFFFKRVCA